MKKAIIVSLLASVLAAGAFAQVSFSGEAYVGIRLTNPPNADESITTDHREYGAPRFDFTVTAGQENYGARLITRATPGSFIVRGIYGWVDFGGFTDAGDSLRLSMGQFADGVGVIQLDSDLPELFIPHTTGFRLAYGTPLPGLTVQAAFRTDGHDMQAFAEQMIIGATYVAPFFVANFYYDLAANVRTLFAINFPSIPGVPDLSAGFKLFALNLATWDTHVPGLGGQFTAYQRIGYRISWPVSVSLIASQTVFASNNPVSDYTELMFGPGITYRNRSLPNLTASFRAMLDSPDHFDTMNLVLRPAIEKSLRGPALFYAQYDLRLPDVGSSSPFDRAVHTIGFGLEIRAF